ncbi:hypothetical protein DER30_1952 [Streptomyces sp. HB202]|nr:hypothetical protein DER30_1952 [Streptomyces sp. HB202]
MDDLEIGGAALDELLAATPECAFLLAATTDTTPGVDGHLEEVLLAGLGRGASLALLEKVVERPLTEEERNWAGDLWFESEGLPLRFVQAGSLLVQRDRLSAAPEEAFDEYDYFEPRADDAPPPPAAPSADGLDVPLPSLGEGAAPAELLASRLSEAARATLRFAVALGGEVPHQAHLPALVGDTHADAALGELAGCHLLSPAGPRYRLAAGVLAQLVAAGYEDEAATHARTAAQHYAWWTSHPSVTPQRAVAEADAIVAALARLVPGDEAGAASAAVLLARSASPAFAAGLGWGAWERALRIGQEAARIAGEVAEEAYFHHELGVLALCTGNPDRARTELETSIGMRGVLADKSGAVAGRRALALVADRSGDFAPLGGAPSGDETTAVRQDLPGAPLGGIPGAPLFLRNTAEEEPTVISSLPPGPAARKVSGRGRPGRRPAQPGRRGGGRPAHRGARHRRHPRRHLGRRRAGQPQRHHRADRHRGPGRRRPARGRDGRRLVPDRGGHRRDVRDPERLGLREPQHLRIALPERLLVERYVTDGRADGRGEQHAGRADADREADQAHQAADDPAHHAADDSAHRDADDPADRAAHRRAGAAPGGELLLGQWPGGIRLRPRRVRERTGVRPGGLSGPGRTESPGGSRFRVNHPGSLP